MMPKEEARRELPTKQVPRFSPLTPSIDML